MDGGYIKLYRKSLESPVFQNENLWMFWCWCLMKASHKKMTAMVGYNKIELEPGQFVFGRKKAADSIPLSERSIRTCLKTLENLKNVTIKTTNRYSIVTVCNWETYQSNNIKNDQQTAQQTTSKRPANDHIQEVKEVKNISISRAREIHTPSGQELEAQIKEVIDYLNEKTDKHFSHIHDSFHIRRWLQENFTVADLKQVVDTKLYDPHFQKNRYLLRPSTLFGDKFVEYLNENPEDFQRQEQAERQELKPLSHCKSCDHVFFKDSPYCKKCTYQGKR